MTESQEDTESTQDETGRDAGREADGSEGDISPKRAWTLHNEQDFSYREIANLSTVSKSTVQRRIKEHEESMEVGKEQVSPDDFELEELQDHIADRESDDNPFEHDCPACGAPIEEGASPCPQCGTALNWDEDDSEE